MVSFAKLSTVVLSSSAAIAMGVVTAAPAKAWTPLMPDSETAVDVSANPSCLNVTGAGINPDSIYGIKSITSQTIYNQPTEGADISSCLIADITTTEDSYPGFSTLNPDLGTNGGSDLWYRPIARDSADVVEEAGMLEYGKFDFTLDEGFSNKVTQLRFTFLDVEKSFNATGVYVGGTFFRAIDGTKILGGGGVDDSYELLIDWVAGMDTFTVAAGSDTANGSGDGVSFRIEADVPEPSMVLGLGLAAGAFFSSRKRRTEEA